LLGSCCEESQPLIGSEGLNGQGSRIESPVHISL
jgi:hypothetical protein